MHYLYTVIIIISILSVTIPLVRSSTEISISKVLVLGSGGLVGSGLKSWLESANYDVIEVRNRRHIDLRNPNSLDVFTGIDFVFFLACEVGGSKYINNNSSNVQLEIVENNVLIYQTVFSWLQRTKTPFIFTSSSLQGQYTSYGSVKRLGENWIKSLGFGKIARLWNIYGYEKHITLKSHVIPDWVNSCLNQGEINSLTDGTELKQFLHVEDTSRGLGLMMENYKYIENIIDLSSGTWIKMKDVANLIISTLNSDLGSIDVSENNSISNPTCSVTFSTLKAHTGELLNPKVTWFNTIWTPNISFETGIRDIYLRCTNEKRINNLLETSIRDISEECDNDKRINNLLESILKSSIQDVYNDN